MGIGDNVSFGRQKTHLKPPQFRTFATTEMRFKSAKVGVKEVGKVCGNWQQTFLLEGKKVMSDLLQHLLEMVQEEGHIAMDLFSHHPRHPSTHLLHAVSLLVFALRFFVVVSERESVTKAEVEHNVLDSANSAMRLLKTVGIDPSVAMGKVAFSVEDELPDTPENRLSVVLTKTRLLGLKVLRGQIRFNSEATLLKVQELLESLRIAVAQIALKGV